MEHETSEGQKMQPGEHGWQTLVIAGKPPEAGDPGEAALDDPAARQQDEAMHRFGQPDDLQLDTVCSSRCGGVVAGIALIDVGQGHRLARDRLHLRGQVLHLRPFLLVSRRDGHGQQLAQGVDRQMRLGTLALPVPVIPTRAPLSGDDCSVRASRMTALGCPVRPASRRSSKRSSPAKRLPAVKLVL